MKSNKIDFTVSEDGADATAVESGVPAGFRRLHWQEPVLAGDFVMDVQRGFELWDGPGGFRADSFVKPVYRRGKKIPSRKLEKS